MKKKTKIVIDTNIFINPLSYRYFGKTPEEAINEFLDRIDKNQNVVCYMPPSVYEELKYFLDIKKVSKKILLIQRKPPSKYQVPIPAIFLYEFIEDIRNRVNKGLRVAEKYTRKALKEKTEESLIKNLRNEYRIALREGIIDSKEDFDLLLLTKELKGVLATCDKGLIKWAYKLGIGCISPQELKEIIT